MLGAPDPFIEAWGAPIRLKSREITEVDPALVRQVLLGQSGARLSFTNRVAERALEVGLRRSPKFRGVKEAHAPHSPPCGERIEGRRVTGDSREPLRIDDLARDPFRSE